MNFVCNTVDVAGIEPALQVSVAFASYFLSNLSRPVERLRVIYRCVPRLTPLVLLLAEFITIPRPPVATYAAKLCAHSLILLG